MANNYNPLYVKPSRYSKNTKKKRTFEKKFAAYFTREDLILLELCYKKEWEKRANPNGLVQGSLKCKDIQKNYSSLDFIFDIVLEKCREMILEDPSILDKKNYPKTVIKRDKEENPFEDPEPDFIIMKIRVI